MKDQDKTKAQLISEVQDLRKKILVLESSQNQPNKSQDREEAPALDMKRQQQWESASQFHSPADASDAQPSEPESLPGSTLDRIRCGFDNGPSQLSAAIKDVGLQIQMQEELSRICHRLESERAKLRAIFDNASLGIVVADESGRITMANAAAAWIYGRPLPIGKDFRFRGKYFRPDGTTISLHDLPLMRSALNRETVINEELQILFPNGRRRDLLVNSIPIIINPKGLQGAAAIIQDITAMKEAERERQQLLAELETTSEELRVKAEELRLSRDKLELRVRERTAELQKANHDLESYAKRLELLNTELQEFAFVASHDLAEPIRKIQSFGSMLRTKCTETLGDEGCDCLTGSETMNIAPPPGVLLAVMLPP